MGSFDHKKYKPFPAIALTDRSWPDNTIKNAPTWCSVDLRDGNQALIEPMSVPVKKKLFQLLVDVGFKQIEIGFPAASQTDFDFVRALIEGNLIPDDVTVQVLTQAREELIKRTYESLQGAKKAIVHVYNSTSTVQREQVFRLDREGIKAIAVNGAQWVKSYATQYPETEWTFQYSPESFTGTEIDYAIDVCNAVIEVWQPSPKKRCIINLPATVEMATPNIFADQVESFLRGVQQRDSIELSIHTHNDRGCAIAAAELAIMAGADRIEGTLLGNGERTGNMDIVTMAMNLYSQGIDPELNLANMDEIVSVIKECTKLPVHPRHPYAGELVYTAFSGSHQDAIKKCLAVYKPGSIWEVAYLPIDPRDLGRTYQEVIRINSQSGKGGIAYVLEQDFGLHLPRWLQIEFSAVVQSAAEKYEGEVPSDQIWQVFQDTYIQTKSPYELRSYRIERKDKDFLQAHLQHNDNAIVLAAEGNGVIQALTIAIEKQLGIKVEVLDYSEHALSEGAEAKAVSYIQAKCQEQRYYGVAISEDIISSSINALLSALNQYINSNADQVPAPKSANN